MVEISDGKAKCILCSERPASYVGNFDTDIYTVTCDICGQYKWLKDIEISLSRLDLKKRRLISGRSKELNEIGTTLEITSEAIIDDVLRSAPKDILDRIDRLLLSLAARSDKKGRNLLVGDLEFSLGYCQTQHELAEELQMLQEDGLLSQYHVQDGFATKLTTEGYRRARDLRAGSGLLSSEAFVAMWFDDKMDELWKLGLEPGITLAGFVPIRLKEIQHNDRIDSLIIYHIKKSRFVVADVTGDRSAVYYEAGFAHGLERTVIWTCNSKKKSDACFDTRQYNHIFWDSPEQLKEELRRRILGTVGQGPGPRASIQS
jgi:hypothetical protein